MILAAASATAHCCTQLLGLLDSKASFPGNTTYQAVETSYWSLQESTLTPACIITPSASADVAKTISILNRNPSCHFAVKGRGHAPAAGFANINAGVTIDTTQLNSITVNADRTIASVGAGASWLDVYTALDPLGITVAGGRNGAVGVGGLTLGGGISYFSPRVGFTCDTVANFEIVLASGSIVNANDTSHPDLFRALKGGANNFGVVTRIDFRTLEQGQILGGSLVQSISNRDRVFQAFANIAGAPQYDPFASIVMGLIFNSTSKTWVLSNTPAYTEPILRPPVYEELFTVPNLTSTLHLTNLGPLSNESATPPLNWLFETGTYGVSAALLDAAFEAINNTVFDFEPSGGVLWVVAFEPLPTAITQHGAGKNVLGISPSDGNAIVMLLSAFWPDSSSNTLVQAKAKQVTTAVDSVAQQMGLLKRFQYANYAGPDQDPIGSYGQQNVEFLRSVSRRYDPKGVFQRQEPGGFKLRG